MTNRLETQPAELNRVPETLLKKRKEQERKTAEKVASIIKKRKQYVKEYRIGERQEIRMRHLTNSNLDLSVPEQAKLLFVIRINKQQKILNIFRLNQINTGVFVRLNKSIKIMLQLVNPYVAYGVPNLKSVHELIYKRGFAKINKKQVPISDNLMIEESLGDVGIICVEDLIHEIFTVGPNHPLLPYKVAIGILDFGFGTIFPININLATFKFLEQGEAYEKFGINNSTKKRRLGDLSTESNNSNISSEIKKLEHVLEKRNTTQTAVKSLAGCILDAIYANCPFYKLYTLIPTNDYFTYEKLVNKPQKLLWKTEMKDEQKIVVKFTHDYNKGYTNYAMQLERHQDCIVLRKYGFYIVVIEHIDGNQLDKCDLLKTLKKIA
nr:8155_t:CDS:2 [Entrophospora candida]